MNKFGITECPECRIKGNKVGKITLQSLILPKYENQISNDEYRFCATPDCNVVYYSENSGQVYHKDALHVRVGLKEKSIPRPVCYCFSHNIEGIELEIVQTGKSTASEDIATRLKNGCWCDTRNPAGKCCLGSVRRVEKELLNKHDKKSITVDEPLKDCCSN